MDEIAKLCEDLAARRFHRADDVALKYRGGHGPLLRSPAKGWKSPVRGFWYRTEPHGLDDGTEGLQRALSALPDPATDQSIIPFDRR